MTLGDDMSNKTTYVMQEQCDGGKWEDTDHTYRALRSASEGLDEMRVELADEPGKPVYRHRLVKRTFTEEVLEG